jgi:ribonuclease Z
MKCFPFAIVLISATLVSAIFSGADAAPCVIVTLTGTQGGPQSFNGLAGAGTLVRYGDDNNNCASLRLQFDAGRGTTMRLSQLGVGPEQLNAVFFTHMHNDHSEGFADLVQLRWSFNGTGPKMPSAAPMRFRRRASH